MKILSTSILVVAVLSVPMLPLMLKWFNVAVDKMLSKICLLCILILTAFASANSQTVAPQAVAPVCPKGLLCLTQEAGNRAFENAKLIPALEAQVATLKQALTDKDKNTDEIKAAADKSIADLKEALHRTEVQLAQKTGELISADSERTRLIAIIDVLVKSTRKKSIGLIAF